MIEGVKGRRGGRACVEGEGKTILEDVSVATAGVVTGASTGGLVVTTVAPLVSSTTTIDVRAGLTRIPLAEAMNSEPCNRGDCITGVGVTWTSGGEGISTTTGVLSTACDENISICGSVLTGCNKLSVSLTEEGKELLGSEDGKVSVD